MSWKKLLGALGAIVVLLLIAGPMVPNTYHASSQATIAAPPEAVFTYLNDLKRWPEWTPWIQADAEMQVTIGDISQGPGASQAWVSKHGNGSLVFGEVVPNSRISYELSFDAFPKCQGSFALTEAEGRTTTLVWEMDGSVPTPLVGGYMALFTKGMVERDFHTGLANLKQLVEGAGPNEAAVVPAEPPPAMEPASEPAAAVPMEPAHP